jgi:O-antigen ligase
MTNNSSRVALVLEGVIFYGLIALIVFTAIPYGTVDPWSQAVFECVAFFLALLWAVHGFLQGSWGIRTTSLTWPMLALVGFAVVQSLTLSRSDQAGVKVLSAISADPFETWIFVLRTGALVLAYLMFVRFTSSQRKLSLLVHTIIVLAVASALFGIIRQTMQHADGFVLARLKAASGYAQFINKNHFAYLMELAFGLLVGAGLALGWRKERALLYLSGLIAISAALVLSLSRGGLLAMTSQVICAVFLLVNSRELSTRGSTEGSQWLRAARSIVAKLILIGVLLTTIVGGVIWLGGDQLVTGVETATSELANSDESHEGARRRDIWRASWQMFRQHPIAGAGLGGYWAEVPVYHEGSGGLTPQQAHNDYLEILASAGLIGAGILAWFAIALVKQARRSLQHLAGFQRAVALGAIVSLTGIAVHSFVDFGLHITINALVFMAVLAMVAQAASLRRVGKDVLPGD